MKLVVLMCCCRQIDKKISVSGLLVPAQFGGRTFNLLESKYLKNKFFFSYLDKLFYFKILKKNTRLLRYSIIYDQPQITTTTSNLENTNTINKGTII